MMPRSVAGVSRAAIDIAALPMATASRKSAIVTRLFILRRVQTAQCALHASRTRAPVSCALRRVMFKERSDVFPSTCRHSSPAAVYDISLPIAFFFRLCALLVDAAP